MRHIDVVNIEVVLCITQIVIVKVSFHALRELLEEALLMRQVESEAHRVLRIVVLLALVDHLLDQVLVHIKEEAVQVEEVALVHIKVEALVLIRAVVADHHTEAVVDRVLVVEVAVVTAEAVEVEEEVAHSINTLMHLAS